MKQQLRKYIIVFILTAIMTIGFGASQAIASSDWMITEQYVGFDAVNMQYEFAFDVQGVANQATNIALALYDNAGMCCSKSIARANIDNNTLMVEYHEGAENYRLMLWGGQSGLQPLCSALDGKVDPWNYMKKVTVLSDSVSEFNEETMEFSYYPIPGDSRVNKITIDANAIYFYNGIWEYGLDDFADILREEDVILVFDDTDSDGLHDEIISLQYTYRIVDEVDTDIETISFIGENRLALDYSSTVIMVDDLGNSIELDDIVSGDVLAVISDSSGNIERYDDYIKIVKVSNSCIKGKVSDCYTEEGISYVEINGKRYANITYEDFEQGYEGVFYTTLSDKIFYCHQDYEALDYAYIMEGTYTENEFSEREWTLTLLTEQGNVITAKALDNEATDEYISDNSRAFAVKDGGFAFENAENSEKHNKARFVNYELSPDNKLSVKTAQNYDFKPINTNLHVYNVSNNCLTRYKLKEEITIYDVSGGVQSAFTTDISHLRDFVGYSGFLYSTPVEYNNYSVMLITGTRDYNLEPSTKLAIALETSETQIRFVQHEREKTIDIAEAEILNASGELPQYGDAFYYVDNGDGKAEKIITIATLEKDSDDQPYFVLTPEADTDEEIKAIWNNNTTIVLGYVLSEGPQTNSSGNAVWIDTDIKVNIPHTANKYLYDADNVAITDYMEYAYEYRGTLTAPPILIRMENEEIIDVYSTTGMFVIE